MLIAPKSGRVGPRGWGYAICFAFGAVFLALAQSTWPSIRQWSGLEPAPMLVAARPSSPTHPLQIHKTPVGTFEYVRLPLGEPDELLPDVTEPLALPRWCFAGHSVVEIKRLFRTNDLTDEQREWLMNVHHWEAGKEGISMSPPLDIVAGLSQTARGQIYAVLAESPVNAPQHYPFRFAVNSLEERMADAGLSTNTLEVVRRLIYVQEGTLCFTDGAVAQRQLSVAEFRTLVKALYRTPTFLMRLKVTPDTDLERVIRYWSRCDCSREVKPLLESLAKVPDGGGAINVEHLLPTFARLRLYTHAPRTSDAVKARQNCFWTALNFFNEQPDGKYLDPAKVLGALKTEYHKPDDERAFGDVVCLMDMNDQPAHMCVFIADDVVFTKNGSDDRQPWVLMKIPDMLMEYPAHPPLKMVTLRRNGR